MPRSIFFLFLVTSLAVLTSVATAQEVYEHLSPVAHGAGQTYAITSNGLDAVGLNPALLTPSGSNRFEFRLFPISSFGLDAGASFRDASAISTVFDLNAAHISDSSRRKIVDLLLDEKFSGLADAEVLGALYQSQSLGTFAFTWTTHFALRTDIPQEFLQFFRIAESQLLQSEGSFSNFDLQGMWYSEYTASYATKPWEHDETMDPFLRSLRLGGALKYVNGIFYAGLDQTNSFRYHYASSATTINVNYIFRSSYGDNFDPKKLPTHFSLDFLTSNSAGSGYGVDLGVAGDLITSDSGRPLLSVAASLTDLGQITWSQHATMRIADNLSRTISINGTIQELNDSLQILSGNLQHISSFTTSLPTMLHFAAGFDLTGLEMSIADFNTKAAIEYDAALSNVVGALNHPRLGIGVTMEQPSETASLRIGVGYCIQSGSSDLTLGIGTTILDRVAIDVASAHVSEFFKSGPSRMDIALGIKALF